MGVDYGGRSGGGGGGGGRSERGTRVYVGGIGSSLKKEDLELQFEKYGKLNNVWVAYNPPGFAFIEFAEQRDAESAVDEMNNAELLGVRLRVEISRGRSGGRRGGGDFRDRGRGGPRSSDRDRYGSRSSGSYGSSSTSRRGGGDSRSGSSYSSSRDSRDTRYRSRSPQSSGGGSSRFSGSASRRDYGGGSARSTSSSHRY